MASAIIYARFSPRPNAQDCESIETQNTLCRAYCENKGHRVIAQFDDPNAGGADKDRPGLWAALCALRRGQVLVAYRPERLARSVFLSETIRRQVARQQASIETVEADTGGDSPEATLQRQILQAFAEYERRIIGARTSAAMKRHQAEGRAMGSVAPYGQRIILVQGKRRLVPDEAEQAAIHTILKLRDQGVSLRRIAARLPDLGHLPRGMAWYARSVRAVLLRAATERGSNPIVRLETAAMPQTPPFIAPDAP